MYDAEHEAFREAFRAFIERDVRPFAAQLAASGSLPEKVFAVAADNGFLGISAPEQHGGAGIDDIRFALLAAEELAAAGLPGPALAFATHSAVAIPLLTRYGTPAQQARWLPAMASGETLAAVAEGQDGEARLVPGADGLLLDGPASTAANATRAGLLLVPARAEGGGPRVAIVGAGSPGLTRRSCPGLLGMPGADLGTAELRAVPVPGDQFLAGAGEEQLAVLRADDQLAQAVVAVASTRTALGTTLEYVRGRTVFGRPLTSFQNTRHVLGGIDADLAICEACLETCVRDRLAGRLPPRLAAAARLRCAELFARAADQCLQLHGGYGYMREYPISQAFADARCLQLYGDGRTAATETLAAGLGLRPGP